MSHVPLYLDILGKPLDKNTGALIRMGNLETKLLTYDIDDIEIEKPIFVSGLARAGSTVLLEILASHHDVASHQYRDYPFVHFHCFWSILRALIPAPNKKVERAHKDGLFINTKSPEALDEILWTSFFNHLHDPTKNNVLTDETQNEDFATFYRNNILKTLYGRKSKRFVSKNNYNISRFKYLLKLFPDARIILPVRKAEDHIYSLLKQNRLFREEQKDDPRSQRYTKRLGHHEFGLDFRPINTGNDDTVGTIMDHWEKEEYLQAYALYWSEIHKYLWQTLENDPALRQAVHIVRYDDLCENPANSITSLLDFCALSPDENTEKWAQNIKKPSYYTKDFSEEEQALIRRLTSETEALFWPDAKNT